MVWRLVIAGLCLSSTAASAQYPRAERGRFEVRGLDFRATGAWRGRTSAIRAERRAMLRSGAVAELNATAGAPGAPRAEGSYVLPVILVQPSNVVGRFTRSQYQELLFADATAGRPYTLRGYYSQLSNGHLQLGGTVFDWWAAPEPNSYYEDGCNGVGVFTACPHPARMGELLLGALRYQDAGGVDWGRFDNDGPDGRSNSGDDDGVVDFVTFLHPDVDGACGTSHIWSHRWVMSAWTGGSAYTTRTPRANRPGEFIRVEDYILTSGVGGSTACSSDQPMAVGTVAHETGHAFGLPDLYDTDLAPTRTEGIGAWGLMGSGARIAPDSPARMEAWSLAELGWVTVDTLASGRVVQAGPVTVSDTVFVIPMPGREEYFLVENRQPLESDTALLNPGRPGGRRPGLLIWHIDGERVRSAGLTSGNAVNSGPVHGVALVQADGADDLGTSGLHNLGDSGDPYPGASGNERLSWQSHPSAADNHGAFAGFMIDRIAQAVPGGAMSFRFTRRERSIITTSAPGVPVVVDGRSAPRFEDVLVPGDRVLVSVSREASSADGRSRYEFTDWPTGAAPAFTLTPRPELPETLIATFAASHRVAVTVAGTGTVATSLDGVVGSGVFLPAGARVRLEPTAAGGGTFLRWSGDTAAAGPLLELVADRPYDVRAEFTVSAAVLAVVDAVNALLGGAPLSAEISLGLDAAGNRNGEYDVGDLLAYLDRVAPSIESAVVQRLVRARR